MNREISQLLNYGLKNGMIEEADIVYAANRILNIIGEDVFEYCETESDKNIEESLCLMRQ